MPDDLLHGLLGDPATLWSNLVVLGNAEHISMIEKLLRPLVIYVFLLVSLTLMGKRELGQLNRFDLVVLLILSNTVQNAIIGNDTSLYGGLLGAIVLLGTNWVVVHFLFRHPALEQIFEGEPAVLVRDGHMLPEACAREQITEDELLAAVRRQGFSDLAQADQVVLETGGAISVIAKQPTEYALIREMAERLERIERRLPTTAPTS